VATRDALSSWRDGSSKPVPGAAREGRTCAAHVGDTAPWETVVSFGGETWTKWYSKAQAVEIVGQLKRVTAPSEGAARGSSASARGFSPLVNKAGNHAASKRGVLEPWSAEIGPPSREVVRVCDPSSHGEALAY
jgi:hypothetical protein